MSLLDVIAHMIEVALDNRRVRADQIADQLPGAQVAPAGPGSPGVVDLDQVPTAFTALTDTPASYTGQAGKAVAVRGDESGLEFVSGGGGGSLTIEEVDGSPSVAASTLRFPNGTLTDDGGGQVTYTPAGGGGGGAPTDAPYITAAADAGLSNAVIVSGLAFSPDRDGLGITVAEDWTSTTPGLTWSPSAPATVDSHTTAPSHLYVECTSATEYLGLRAFTPSGDFEAWTKCQMISDMGIVLGSILLAGANAADDRLAIDCGYNLGYARSWLQALRRQGGSTTGGDLYEGRLGLGPYYTLIKRVGSTITYYACNDGVSWCLIWQTTISFTITQIGVRVFPYNLASGATARFYFDFLRATG